MLAILLSATVALLKTIPFPFANWTDYKFAEITDVTIDVDHSKSFKTDTLNATELNFIYRNKIHNDTELIFNNDTDQDGLWSQSTGCKQYIPSKDAHFILCDKECSDNIFIALYINSHSIIITKVFQNWRSSVIFVS